MYEYVWFIRSFSCMSFKQIKVKKLSLWCHLDDSQLFNWTSKLFGVYNIIFVQEFEFILKPDTDYSSNVLG